MMVGDTLAWQSTWSDGGAPHWVGRHNRGALYIKFRSPEAPVSALMRQAEHGRVQDDIYGARCNVHILPHPIAAVSDERGRYALPALPPGDYELFAIHELLGTDRRQVSLRADAVVEVDILLRVPEELRSR